MLASMHCTLRLRACKQWSKQQQQSKEQRDVSHVPHSHRGTEGHAGIIIRRSAK